MVEYDQWYLHNITNTAQVQKTNNYSKKPVASNVDSASSSESAKVLDKLTLSDTAKQQMDVQMNSSKREDPPDFRAISLIKNSKIDIAIPKVSSQTLLVDQLEVAKEEKKVDFAAAVNANEIVISTPKANSREESDPKSAFVEEISSPVETEMPKKSAIKLLNKSDISKRVSMRFAEKVEVPSTKTSSEVEVQRTSAKITPYEEKSMETYQNVIAYTNPLNMSNALAQAV